MTGAAARSRSSNSVLPRRERSSQRAAHAQRELAGDRQPEPRAAHLVAGVEALEDALARARVDSGPVVGDDEAGRAVLDLSPYRDRCSLRRVRESVVDEDTHDLSDPVRVGARGRGDPGADLDRGVVAPGGGAELLGHPPGDVGELDPLAADLDRVGVELREVEQVDGQLRQPRDLLSHRAHELGPGLGVGIVVLEQLDEAREREDRRAQLVRGVGDELPAGAVERREPLLHLVEGHRQLSDLVVGVDRDRAREVAVGNLLGRLLEPPQAPRVRAGDEPAGTERREQRDHPRDQDLAADQGDVVVDVGEVGREDGDPARLAAVARARSPTRRAARRRPSRPRSPPTPRRAAAAAAG